MIEILKCEGCGNEYLFNNAIDDSELRKGCKQCIVNNVIDSNYIPTIKEIAQYDEILLQLAEKNRIKREEYMHKMLQKHLRWHHRLLFFLYRKLADFFSEKVVVINICGEGYQESIYGVKIYGKHYIHPEKEITQY